jgi:hypothetical protein
MLKWVCRGWKLLQTRKQHWLAIWIVGLALQLFGNLTHIRSIFWLGLGIMGGTLIRIWGDIIRLAFETFGTIRKERERKEKQRSRLATLPYPVALPKNITGPIVGYKIWGHTNGIYPLGSYLVYAYPGTLVSPMMPFLWEAGKNDSSCIPQINHNAGGFYVLKEPNDLQAGILGLLLCWGKTVLAKDGWRCQYAMPLALIDHPLSIAPLPSLSKLAKGYGIPVVSMEEAAAIIKRWNEEGQ